MRIWSSVLARYKRKKQSQMGYIAPLEAEEERKNGRQRLCRLAWVAAAEAKISETENRAAHLLNSVQKDSSEVGKLDTELTR